MNGLNAFIITFAGKASSSKVRVAIGNFPLKRTFLKCGKPHIVPLLGPKPNPWEYLPDKSFVQSPCRTFVTALPSGYSAFTAKKNFCNRLCNIVIIANKIRGKKLKVISKEVIR